MAKLLKNEEKYQEGEMFAVVKYTEDGETLYRMEGQNNWSCYKSDAYTCRSKKFAEKFAEIYGGQVISV